MKPSIEICIALGIACLSHLPATHSLGYETVPLGIPVAYSGDGLSAGMLIKGIVENGWYLENPQAGAPFGLSWGPYPMVDASHFFWIKMLGWFSADYATVMTVFYLTSFMTSSLTSYAAMRFVGIGRTLAACGALLFALQSYHFLRGAHLFLSVYFSVPIFIALAMALHRYAHAKLTFLRATLVSALLLWASGGGVYYAFFGCLLIAFAAASASIERATWRPIVLGASMVAVIAAGVALALTPHWIDAQAHSSDAQWAVRHPQESEVHGLKLIQMVLPSALHRNGRLSALNATYRQASPLVGENVAASIGIIASIGFFLSLAVLVIPKLGRQIPGLWQWGQLNFVAFMFATIGGVGTLFAWLVTPQIRGLNRISIVIAFISLCALLALAQQLLSRIDRRTRRIPATAAVALAVCAIGLWDQTPGWVPKIAAQNQAVFLADAAMGARIMEALPQGSRVFQLPNAKFPEAAPLHQEGTYGLARWYLNTSGIDWSYGAMIRTESDQWLEHVESFPLETRIQKLSASGFDAVMVDRRAYADNGAAVEPVLIRLLGSPLLECPDASCALYRLDATRLTTTAPLLLALRGRGWSPWAKDAKGHVSSSSTGDKALGLILLNPAKYRVHATLRYVVSSNDSIALEATLDQAALRPVVLAANEDVTVEEQIELPPGVTQLMLRTPTLGRSPLTVTIRNLDLYASVPPP